MKNTIAKILFMLSFLLLIWQCTPADSPIIVEPDTHIPVYKIELWSQPADTFRVYDSSSVLKIYADLSKDSVIITDSTKVKFYAYPGTITKESYTEGGQAMALYSAFIDSNTVYNGNLSIKASFAPNKIIYDTLNIFVLDCRTRKTR